MSDKKRVQVSFTEEQREVLEGMKDTLGDPDADVVRNIVIAWLAEKSFITQHVKEEQ
jgi:hypothetical protein